MNIIVPPEYRNFSNPIIFLAGPIQGANKWQDTAIELIHKMEQKIVIANPRRNVEFGDFDKTMYGEQVDWETHYLREAAIDGAILFWLSKETEHKCTRAYAQTTRFELAEWLTWYKMEGQRLGKVIALGIEEGFTGGRYIKRRVSQDIPGLPVHDDLEATCRYAVRMILANGALGEVRDSPFDDQDHWLNKHW